MKLAEKSIMLRLDEYGFSFLNLATYCEWRKCSFNLETFLEKLSVKKV